MKREAMKFILSIILEQPLIAAEAGLGFSFIESSFWRDCHPKKEQVSRGGPFCRYLLWLGGVARCRKVDFYVDHVY